MFRLIGTVPISFDSKNSMPVERRWYHDRPEIDPSIADQMHANLGSHREYFHSRGISDRQIDLHKLGWTSKYGGRYTIPCYAGYPDLLDSQVLHGIQMRASDPADERRYISVTGSRNNVIFNSVATIGNGQRGADQKKLKAVVIVEGPLDALAITSALEDHGVVGVAPFRGNNKFHAWEREWNQCVSGAMDRLIVPDNDKSDTGDLIAFSRLNEIPRSRIIRLPDKYKDCGEAIKAGENIAQLLGLSKLE